MQNTSIDCLMMTSSFCQTCSMETYSYILRVLGLITAVFVTIFLIICNITSKIEKETSYRLSDDDVISMQKFTFSSILQVMTRFLSLIEKETSYRLSDDDVISMQKFTFSSILQVMTRFLSLCSSFPRAKFPREVYCTI